jgi:hypothetical protein
MVYVHNHTLMDSSSDDDLSFIVSDTEDPLNAEEQGEVDVELSRLQAARVGLTEAGLSLDYLHGLSRPRVHARVLAKAEAAAGSEWSVAFADALRNDERALFEDIVEIRHGLCTACARPRILSKAVVFSNGAPPACLGSTCAKRAIVMHTLLHAQEACTQKLDTLPLARLGGAEEECVAALDDVLDAADDVVHTIGDGGGRGQLYQVVRSARAVLGIQMG